MLDRIYGGADAVTLNEALIFILTGTIGTVGFSFLFKMDWKYLPYATLCGTLACIVYIPVNVFTESLFVANIASALAVTLYSEIFARVCRTPTTMFIIPGMIPLVPGSSLYYTMSNLIVSDYNMAILKFIDTILVIVGLAFGIAAGSIIVSAIKSTSKAYRTHRMTKKKK